MKAMVAEKLLSGPHMVTMTPIFLNSGIFYLTFLSFNLLLAKFSIFRLGIFYFLFKSMSTATYESLLLLKLIRLQFDRYGSIFSRPAEVSILEASLRCLILRLLVAR